MFQQSSNSSASTSGLRFVSSFQSSVYVSAELLSEFATSFT
uniref:Uncharacterized protein n=1 Tax=Aegilops tauschii subsp. strangulata TaxID=200361 RepID=A0A453RLS1_AEGTS